MPGGRDLPYLEKLGDEGAEQIMNFIRMGGTYVGLCAGAYFGASNVVFEPNTPLEVIGERPLKLINGVAYGTLYPEKQFVYGSEAGALVSKVKTADGSSINVYYNGGCAFNISCMDDVEVLGWYEDVAGQPPAILRANHGKGYAVLSGVHLEIGPNNAGPEISADIKVTDKLRLQLLAKLLNFKQN